jgi:phosphopentomutase
MLLDLLDERDVPVFGVGKIFDIFVGRGIRDYEKTKNNADGMAKTLAAAGSVERGLIFVDLIDFDQQYGHRNDVEGYANALEEFDGWLPALLEKMAASDLLILNADHGCDPTTPSTDHSREYVPVLAYAAGRRRGADLGLRSTLSDVGQTIAGNFGVHIQKGISFLPEIL